MSRKRKEKKLQKLRRAAKIWGFDHAELRRVAQSWGFDHAEILEKGKSYVLTKPAFLGRFPSRRTRAVIPAEVQGPGPARLVGPITVLTLGRLDGPFIDGKAATPAEVREWWKALGYTDEDFPEQSGSAVTPEQP